MASLAAVTATALAQEEGQPPPAATGTDVPTSYFGPPPSEVNRELVGPVALLRSGKLDRKRGTIRLPLNLGHMRDGRNVWYIQTDTTDRDNGRRGAGPQPFGQARVLAGRPGRARTGKRTPQRQGLNSALVDKLDPLHVIGGIPTLALDYNPLWDINLGRWTPDAVRRGYRSRLIDEFQLLEFVRRGHITGPAGARYGSVGIGVNCPIVHGFL